ncbi:MAG: hypothetical protein Q9175_006792 [Cornicularia normoerica]
MDLLYILGALLCCSTYVVGAPQTPYANASQYSPEIQKIIKAATADGIDLVALPFASAAFAGIEDIQKRVKINNTVKAERIDVHVPPGTPDPLPPWSVQSHLDFMAANDISHDVISISTPGSQIFPQNRILSVGLARLLNEWASALVRTYPDKLSFYATAPLPYVEAAIKEIEYSRSELGAVGTILLSNHEGYYLGDPLFTPFFTFLNSRPSKQEVIFIHPQTPFLRLNGTLVPANPTPFPTFFAEFFFDTARTVMSLTLSLTLQNYTHINYQLPHEGDAWPSIEDRLLKSGPVALELASKKIYNTRFWYDSAGPVFYNQVKGLLGYGVPTTQLVLGTDYPYVPPFVPPFFTTESIPQSILDADFITEAQKLSVFTNAKNMFGGHI